MRSKPVVFMPKHFFPISNWSFPFYAYHKNCLRCMEQYGLNRFPSHMSMCVCGVLVPSSCCVSLCDACFVHYAGGTCILWLFTTLSHFFACRMAKEKRRRGQVESEKMGNCRELHSLFLCQILVQQRRRMKKKSPNCLLAIASVTWLPCLNAPWFFKRCQGVANLSIEIEAVLRNCRQHGRSEETFGGALCPFCRNGTLLKIDTVAVSGRLSALIQFSPTHVSWWWWFISCKTWAQNCELGWHHVISDLSVTIIFLKENVICIWCSCWTQGGGHDVGR